MYLIKEKEELVVYANNDGCVIYHFDNKDKKVQLNDEIIDIKIMSTNVALHIFVLCSEGDIHYTYLRCSQYTKIKLEHIDIRKLEYENKYDKLIDGSPFFVVTKDHKIQCIEYESGLSYVDPPIKPDNYAFCRYFNGINFECISQSKFLLVFAIH